jgi:hypothetical protein
MVSLHRSISAIVMGSLGVLAAGCTSDRVVAPIADAAYARAGYNEPGMHRQYGTPIKLGNGMARTYVVLDAKSGGAPQELGIALDASALQALPDDHEEHSYVLPMPAQGPAPYQFAELDWNPHGHEPAGVYTLPHFDFHFYAISQSEWNSIVPSNPLYAAQANNVPTGAFVPPFYIVPGPPAAVAVPKMGVHWLDVRSPELQGLFGHPENAQTFTKTFIYGSWNGRFTFFEPMITRAYLLTNPSDVVTNIPVPAARPVAGYYPSAYRVTYDAQAKEYRIALTSLSWSNAGGGAPD